MGDIDREAATGFEGRHGARDGGILGGQLPGLAAAPTIEVSVLCGGQDVELLATVRPVAVADDPEALEDVERSIDGRWDRVGIDGPTALDELRAGDVTVGRRQDLDEDPPLRCPAKAARPEPIRDAGPWLVRLDDPLAH
jgi:hypothetical protein